jgi:hypothetical protein
MNTPVTTPEVSFSFDIGVASIGWAAFRVTTGTTIPEVLGCGALLFPKEDCQNNARSVFRRQRRHIAATRNRVARIKTLLVSIGALTEAEATAQKVAAAGVMMPWLLAARALNGAKLSWMDLWQILRWFAHNRGYDGNERWAREGDESKDDTQKVQNANALMEKFGTKSMSETICAYLKIKIDDNCASIGEKENYFKGESVAFPREVVRNEVARVVRSQFGVLKGCDEAFLSLLMGRDLTAKEKKRFKLPERYAGGLLFGQMIPRFDNRIITTCPVSGEKTPLKNCTDYYRYRWARLVANIRVIDAAGGKRVLTGPERALLTQRMEAVGGMNKKDFRKAVEEVTHADAKALDAQFFTPEAEKALVLNPVRDALSGVPFKNVWPLVPAAVQKKLAGEFYKRGRLSLADIVAAMKKAGADTANVENAIRADLAKPSKRKEELTYEAYVGKAHKLAVADGRAPFSREVMKRVYEEALSGMDPAAVADGQPDSAPAKCNGCIAITNEYLDREAERELDELTNNHLVRQRIGMFRRLFKDMFEKYAGGDVRQVGDVTVEVARDLQEYSGKNAKEKAALFSDKARPFQSAEKKLLKDFADAGITIKPSYAMIRKARIAMAQKWICPYTGRLFSASDIAYDRVDFEHIIPHASRRSDALEGLAITFREINKRKGKRSALQFIRDGGEDLMTESRFREFVDGLYPKYRPGRDASDEDKINWRRKEWLLKEDYDERDADFTKAALTVTSHLNKLAALEARKFLRAAAKEAGLQEGTLPEYRVAHINGAITGEFRKEKSWDLLGCLCPVCPEVIDQNSPEKRHLPKGEIRNITHLHHAVDAITIGIARNLFRGHVVTREACEAILSRHSTPEQRRLLEGMGIFQFDAEGRHELRELPEDVRENIIEKLREYRVVQHVPHSMHGLRAEQTQWRVLRYDEETERVLLAQYTRDAANGNVRKKKEAWENPNKLLGYKPSGDSKLKPRQAVVVISDNFGIALCEEPVVIPFHNVWKRLQELAEKNGGKIPAVLRQGDVIDVPSGRYKGRWKIYSTKDCAVGVQVDMAWPHLVKLKDKMKGYARNIMLKTLIKDGMTIVHQSLVGS